MMRICKVFSLLLVCCLYLGTSQPAQANAVSQVSTVPAKTDWAFGLSDYDVLLQNLRPLYDQLAGTIPLFPSFDQLSQGSKNNFGVDLLDSNALSGLGFDVKNGLVVHGAVIPKFKGMQGLTVSVSAIDATKLGRWLEGNLSKFLAIQPMGEKRIRGTSVKLFGSHGSIQMGVAIKGSAVHLFSASNKKLVVSEAKRVLQSRRAVSKTKLNVHLLDAGTTGHAAGFVNFKPIVHANIRSIKANIKEVKADSQKPKEMKTAQLAWLNEELKSKKAFLRMKYVTGCASLNHGEWNGSSVLTLDKKTLKKYRKILTASSGPAFNVDALRSNGMAYAVANVMPKAVFSMLRKEPAMKRELDSMFGFFQRDVGVDLENILQQNLTGPSLWFLQGFAAASEAAAPEKNDDNAEPPSNIADTLVGSRIQTAIVSRIQSQEVLDDVLNRIVALAKKIRASKKYDVPIRMQDTAIDGVRYVTFKAEEAGMDMSFHVGVGKGSLLVGMGPELPQVAGPWLDSNSMQNASLVEGELAVTRIVAAIQNLFLDSRVSARERKEWQQVKTLVDMFFAGTVSGTIAETTGGYRLSIRAATPR